MKRQTAPQTPQRGALYSGFGLSSPPLGAALSSVEVDLGGGKTAGYHCVFFLLLLIVGLVFIFPNTLSAQTKIYDSIDFTGLVNLNKQGIAIKSGITVSDAKKLLADPEKIREYLSKEPLVASFKLIDKKNRLSIVVKEREVRYTAAVTKGNSTLLFEVDAAFVPFTRDMHRQDLPLVVVNDTDIEHGRFGRRAIKVFELLERVRSQPLFKELRTISLRSDGLLDIELALRPTIFTVSCTDDDLKRLSAIAGWCDAQGKYPPRLVVRPDFTVIR